MGYKRGNKVYFETTDSRTFHLLHIKCVTGCCLGCARRGRRKWYRIPESDKLNSVYPNWKLVSKNKKQWQKKPIKKEKNGWFETITW
jgi:hypothetical protein